LLPNFAKGRSERLLLLIVCALFVTFGWPFVKRMGIEVDEAAIMNGFYPRTQAWYSWRIFHHDIPIMLLSYLGAPKGWFLLPFIKVWGASAASLRVPTAVLGACTIALFWKLLDDTQGRVAAWTGAILLATDTSFLLLTTIDFGPVALEIFLKTAAMLLFARWYWTRRTTLFAAAWFLLGLAFWDKAVFSWIFFGLAAGALAAFPRAIRAAAQPKLIALAALAFVTGAFPLIVYNTSRPLDTLRSNAKISAAEAFRKTRHLQWTLDGSVLSGFFVALTSPPEPAPLETPLRSALAAISVAPGTRPRNFTVWVFGAAIAAIPVVWRTTARAPAIFGLVSFVAGWLPMAVTSGAGATAHHVVLLWPMQFLAIAVVAAALSTRTGRWLPVCLSAVLALAGLRCTAGYFTGLVRYGPNVRWTDAVNNLTHDLDQSNSQRIFVVDWGILESVNMLGKGKLPVFFADEYRMESPEPARIPALRSLMVDPATLFVSHTPAYEVVAGSTAAVDRFAAAAGYRRETVATIADRFGRPTFEIFRYQPWR
jgi:hypothetical protein